MITYRSVSPSLLACPAKAAEAFFFFLNKKEAKTERSDLMSAFKDQLTYE